MLNLFTSPRIAIAEAKHNRSFGYTFLLLVLRGVGAFLGTVAFLEGLAAEIILLAVLVMASVVVCILVAALLVRIVMALLTGTKGYYEALTLITLPKFIGVAGFLIASLLGLIPYAGPVLMGIVMVFTIVLSVAFLLKLGMELYSTDALTVVIGVGVVVLAVASGVGLAAAKMKLPALIAAAQMGFV